VESSEKTKTLQRRPSRIGSAAEVVAALRSDPLYTTVSDVVHWREPIRSGLVFAIIVLGWFLVSQAEYSVMTLIAYLYLGLFLASFALVQYSNVSSKPHLFKERFGEIADVLSLEQARGHAETTYRLVDSVTLLARDALFFTDVGFSLKALALTLTLAILGNLVSLPNLLFAATVILFAVPRIYEEKKVQIDEVIAKATAAINEKLSPILEKVPIEKLKLKQE
jgi:hypothetical protein